MANEVTTGPGANQGTELKRVLGPKLLLLFIIGDVLGTGIYALTGSVAGEVGGAVWVPFLVAFAVAILTAFSYLELVTKYPQAAGAALYTHKAFGIHFLTFLVCYTVMASGITSASTASRAFAGNLSAALGTPDTDLILTLTALGFIIIIAAVNLRGVAEGVGLNVILTCIELTGLTIVILAGVWALLTGEGDPAPLTQFDTSGGGGAFTAVTAATALAFYALIGFEDSVNMAEETKEPERIFPKTMLTALVIAAVIYVLVSITAVTLVPLDQLKETDTPLLDAVEAAWPWFPIGIFATITIFAVANTALINMLMASRLLYGMAREQVLPPVLGRVSPSRRTPYVSILFTTALSFGLIVFLDIVELGGVTSLLLLGVFTIVNIVVLVLRRDEVDHQHFRAPTVMPVIGAIACGFLVTPWSGRETSDYRIAGILLAIGLVLWALTWFINRGLNARRTIVRDPANLE